MNKKSFFLVPLVSVFLSSLLPAIADVVKSDLGQEEGLENLLFAEIPMVVTSSRKEESIDVAPNVMYVLTAKDIKKYGIQSISDIFNRIPGFYTGYRPLEPVAVVRGIAPNENNKVTYMLNGHRINNVNQTTDLIWPINLDNADRVEIIVGPGSVLYGVDTLVATVNIITKEMNGKEVALSAGQDSSYSASAMVGNISENEDKNGFFASATYTESDGWDSENFYRHSGERIAKEGSDLFSRTLGIIRPSTLFFAKGKYGDWTFQGSSMNQGFPDYAQDRPELDIKATWWNYVNTYLVQNNKSWNDTLSTTFQLSVDDKRMMRTIDSNYNGTDLDTSQKLYSAEYSLQWKNDVHFFQAGIQGSLSNNRHNYSISNFNPNGGPNDAGAVQGIIDPDDVNVLGGYLSEEFKMSESVTLVGASRFDSSSQTQSGTIEASPRAALVFHPFDKWTLKAMYNTATKYPNPWESESNKIWNLDRGASWADIPAYKPEKLTTYEIQSIHYVGQCRASLNVYHQELNDFIGWQNSFTNMGDFTGNGVEGELRFAISDKADLWLNASFEDTEFKAHGTGDHGILESPDGRMNAVPEYMANLGGSWEFLEKMTVSATWHYWTHQTVRRYETPNFQMTPEQWQAFLAQPGVFNWEQANGISYLDVAVLWEGLFGGVADFRISGKNILDQRDRVSIIFANGDYEPQGSYWEGSVFTRF